MSSSLRQFILYIGVGMLNTLFGYSVFAFFIFLKFHYTLACLAGTCLGVLFNFKTTGKIVFQNNNNSLLWRFCLVYALSYALNILLIKFNALFYQNMYLNGALALPFTVITTYLLSKYFVFTKKQYEYNS